MATAAESPLYAEITEKPVISETEAFSTSKPQKEKKIGHRRVDAATGLTTYKKTPSSALSRAIQLGISHTVSRIIAKPERDVLLQDFQVVETTFFPAEGSNITPAHHYNDFRFKTYAPVAFRYFRELFGILPEDFMVSISAEPLTELSNPGASGSLFFVTHDDEFIIKTVQHKEAEFLQKLLPGYYMMRYNYNPMTRKDRALSWTLTYDLCFTNLVQNPRTLLPKFYGLYCIQAGGKNIRMVVMNNLLPSHLKMHLKFDLKGSTFKRKASKTERAKKSPTFKDLDMLSDLPDGILLETDIHAAFIKTMQRDCLVLRSFKIMDYSLLLGIHYTDRDRPTTEDPEEKRKSNASGLSGQDGTAAMVATPSGRRDPTKRNTHTDSIMSATLLRDRYANDLELWSGGIPATSSKGERLLLFCGLIDILQCYKLIKKLEHTWKAMVHEADSVSVHRPGFYCERFQRFMSEHVFKKAAGPIKAQPTKRRAQTTRKLYDAAGAGNNLSPLTRSRASPAHIGGTKLQSDRPDLLPSESPRPANNDSQEENSDDGTDRPYVASQTSSRIQLRMDENSATYATIGDNHPVLGENRPVTVTSQPPQRLTSFATRSKETEFQPTSDVVTATRTGWQSSQDVRGPEQVKLHFQDRVDDDELAGGDATSLDREVAAVTSFAVSEESKAKTLENDHRTLAPEGEKSTDSEDTAF